MAGQGGQKRAILCAGSQPAQALGKLLLRRQHSPQLAHHHGGAPALIDYVVVHELAHLAVMDHSPRYWKRVERAMPDYRDRRRKRLNEVGLHLWL